MKEYKMILLATEKDIITTLSNLKYFKTYIQPKEIIIIGTKKAGEYVNNSHGVTFLCENDIFQGMSYQNINLFMENMKPEKTGKLYPGWYFQQFLKMAYAYLCEEEWYLIWDSDTIPLHNIEMLKDKRAFFDMKSERNQPYFDTFKALFPDAPIDENNSYISEHMLIHTESMREMIEEILQREDLAGEFFWEKILSAVTKERIKKSGFSEFETYGNYMMYHAPELYQKRKWESVRDGGHFFENHELSEKMIRWMGKDFDAITFESYHSYYKLSKYLINSMFRWVPCCIIIKIIRQHYRK